jgi:hypothetical protein
MRFLLAFFNGFYEIVLQIIAYAIDFYNPFKTGFVKGISRAVVSEVRRQKLGAERLLSFLALKTVF